MKKLNKNLLVDLVSIQSTSNDDIEILNYIKTFVSNLASIETKEDDFGNFYCTKGTGKNGYKCIVSHVDTVHDIVQDRAVYEFNDIIFAYGSKVLSKGTKWESHTFKQVGIGGDNRCGIYICLQMLYYFDDIKVVFFRKEEVGRLGSRASDLSFFNDCNFIIQPDRKGNSDFITTSAGVKMASPEFVTTVSEELNKYNYKEAIGVATDVDVLKSRGVNVCCVNVSCGYYDAHTDNEYINLLDLTNCENLVFDLFTIHGNTRFEHTYTAPVYNYTNNYHYNRTVDKKWNYITHKLFGRKNYIEDTHFLLDLSTPIKYNGCCPDCGENHLYFLPTEEMFYCTGSCNDYIYNIKDVNKLKKNFTITSKKVVAGAEVDNEDTFVFSETEDGFLRRQDCYWDGVADDYLPTTTEDNRYDY